MQVNLVLKASEIQIKGTKMYVGTRVPQKVLQVSRYTGSEAEAIKTGMRNMAHVFNRGYK